MLEIAGDFARTTCAQCAIRHRAVCGALSNEELMALTRLGRFRDFEPGDVILADQEPIDFFANIVSGVVKLEKTSADGRQQIVGLLFSSDFLGRAYAHENPYFAQATTKVKLCTFSNSAFEKLLISNPDLERRMFINTLNELDACREWMFLLGRKNAREKVATFLHMIAKRQPLIGCGAHQSPGTACFELPLTRADIADFLGLTIETVSRQLTILKKEGAISILKGREIGVPDLERLHAIADPE